jgi:hypothetical protein
VLRTRTIEDADMRRVLCALSVAAGLVLAAAGAFPTVAAAKPSSEPFEITPGSFHLTPSTTHAAAHEDLTTTFDFARDGAVVHNDVRTVTVDLPAGFIGSNTAVPTCTVAQLIGGRSLVEFGNPRCPVASQVGQISFEIGSSLPGVVGAEQVTVPLYSMEVNSFGLTAQLGFNVQGVIIQTLDISVRPGDSGLTVTTPNIEKIGEAHNISVTVWGLPASSEHDAQRGLECYSGFSVPCNTNSGSGTSEAVRPLSAGIPVKPFLSNPTDCEPHIASLEAYSWEQPNAPSTATVEVPPIDECRRVPFSPEIKTVPTTNSAESPSGLGVSLEVPQTWDNPFSLSTANLKDAVVTLPQGYSLNPSAGSGLGVCTEAQLAEITSDSPPEVGCPAESKLGTVEVETPVLTERATPLDGSAVYVAKPFENPFHSLLALYVVARIPSRGIIVKVAGKVTPDPVTGQLTTTFDENPQVPFSRFTLNFRQGATSPLVSPPVCGRYAAEADLSPWSAPESFQHLISEFEIEHGIGGGPCPSGGVPPFHPTLNAGTINNRAGSYSPFYVRLSRNDGEQEITHFSIKLPPGVVGKLAGIPECSDAAIAIAKSREHDGGGAEEEASPSCPGASEVGHTLVEAGVGSVLAQAPGKVYLAGPYHGAPISVVAITAAKVGPFDLGTVVVREALKINPETAEVFVDSTGSDPLPHIVSGIPTHLRNIRIYMDKPEFVLNPTNCTATSTASTVLGSGKDFVSEADDQPVTVTSPFQAADCAALGFRPKLKLQLKGGKTRRGGLPGLKAVLTARPGDANIGEAQVTLPPSEFLEQGHLKDVCPRSIWIQGQVPGEMCPAKSIYGHARATTPLLSEPLSGPVYLRTGYGTRLPEMVAALNAQEINVDVVGEIDSVHQKGSEVALLRNTFKAVPDAPVTRFELELEGGKKGLLVNSRNVCKGTHKALAAFTGQNGKLEEFEPTLEATSCKGGKKKGSGKGAKKNGGR